MRVEKYRDLTLLYFNDENIIVIACDSCGGIGLKAGDELKTDNKVVGYFTASVVLCELLSFKVKPQMIVNNLCVEMNPTGKEIIAGIKEAVEEIELDPSNILTGSTEENMPVIQTGIGITCIGTIDKKSWLMPTSKAEDAVFVIGTPKVGAEVLKTEGISNLKIISKINYKKGVNEMLPVGSKGIDYEISELCRCNKLQFQYIDKLTVDIKKSAGPVTCVLVSGDKNLIEEMLSKFNVSYSYLGRLY
ncbi:selenophosphate synthase [Alkalibaculum sp. M08DMB]|uniref:Selenophosphate synthase n=1 Tax=Alkalibaculum sporogenes TaxID=2655001 RepID=A0A6A7KBN7_9FIRM|nr:selenophosphate synthase [Alkalibaculum sporogenes]MPW26928.1 selenophosphate synthase [Alkalibaculum sporogenes]